MKHLDDEILQMAAVGRERELPPESVEHLNNCEKCQREIALYRHLFREINKEQIPALKADFSSEVLKHIKPRQVISRSVPEYILALILIVSGMGVTVLYTGSHWMLNAFQDLKVTNNPNSWLFLTAGLVIGLLFLLDRIFETLMRKNIQKS